MPPSFLARYQAGESVQVWADLIALGPAVRSPAYFEDAYAVALETMRRVRRNVEIVYKRLVDIGYQFWFPEQAFVPPSPGVSIMIAEIERLLGPLPLSLRAFYEVVGSVDFEQSPRQLSRDWYDPSGQTRLPDLQVLGVEDPLVVAPIHDVYLAAQHQPERLYFCFAPDEFHKASYSGGENYHVWLPNPDADFRIEGMYDVDEHFVAYLRAIFTFGGFRGRIEIRGQKLAPQLQIINVLAADLLPI